MEKQNSVQGGGDMKKAAVAITGAALVAMLAAGAARAEAQCCGDCNGDGAVTVNEIVTAVNRALTNCSDDGICSAAGMHGLQRVDFSSAANSDSPKKAFAKCPAGKTVIGGGAKVFIANTPTAPVALMANFPSDALDGWAATAEEMAATDAKWFVTAFALCATVGP
jgi:hypothetical protein